ncbi:DUF348 domain-containing protein [Actinomycetaceae bacterium TAE3-ERU4]|nr:DUF348 domain-containing protein [Actinomycetaceae bacterium TAE3-ERU4]
MSNPLAKANERLYRLPAKRVWPVAAALMLGVTGVGAVNLAASHHTVQVQVDGKTQQVSFFGNTVSDALSAAGVEVKAHDSVIPVPSSAIYDDSRITVATAKPYMVTIDGKTREVWSTATSSADILSDLGARGSTVTLAASRSSERSPLSTLTHVPTTAKLLVDGKTKDVKVSPGQGLKDLLQAEKIKLSPIDRVTASRTKDGLVIRVVRVVRENIVTESDIPNKTVKKEDAKLLKGKTRITEEGKHGKRRLVEYREVVDGKETVRTKISDKVLAQPVDRVEVTGTMEPPARPAAVATAPDSPSVAAAESSVPPAAPAPTGSPKAIARQMLAARGMGDDQYRCLVSLWNRESGWNYRSYNRSSGAYGIPQALPGSKMASAGADWRTNPATQIRWGLGYISGRYGSPCAALGHSHRVGWY